MKKKGKPRGMLGRKHGLAGSKKQPGVVLSPTTVNGLILGSGVLLGLASWSYKDSPLGGVLLGAGANIAAIALFFLVKELAAPITAPRVAS